MKLGKKGTWWYCPTNTTDEFHKSFVEVKAETPTEARITSTTNGFQKAGDIAKGKNPAPQVSEEEMNQRLDFELLLMEEMESIQKSLAKIIEFLKNKPRK